MINPVVYAGDVTWVALVCVRDGLKPLLSATGLFCVAKYASFIHLNYHFDCDQWRINRSPAVCDFQLERLFPLRGNKGHQRAPAAPDVGEIYLHLLAWRRLETYHRLWLPMLVVGGGRVSHHQYIWQHARLPGTGLYFFRRRATPVHRDFGFCASVHQRVEVHGIAMPEASFSTVPPIPHIRYSRIANGADRTVRRLALSYAALAQYVHATPSEKITKK